ncbi:3-oxoacyl-ACP synthase III family protein [Actinokineospora inagensis]|uniref:3-oxoacyl-ACP synthase III family protein n=1 Tax=Actinokineospora inagensis TaxID=103730 RepID=UPI000400C72D|nr:3-oxoacyl-ACP synthase III family protein [Actinokineospora inagensis]
MAEINLAAVGTALPGPPIDNARLGELFGSGPVFAQWIDSFIGTKTRHLAVDLDTGEITHSLADLGESAGRRALAAAGRTAADIDLVVLGTATPDALMPATVNLIADRLGIDGVPTYQLQSGCSGAVQALDIAHQLITTGRHRTALVLGGDVCAKHVDLSVDFAKLPPEQLINTVLFGDGAGAAVLTGLPVPDPVRLRRVLVRFTGLNRPPGQRVEWFGLGDRHLDLPAFAEDFKAIEESVPVMAGEILDELLKDEGWVDTDVDYLLPPQLSVRMTDEIVRGLDLPGAREISCVADTGNAANALPFFQLERLLPDMGAGTRAVAIAVESSKWIKAGLVLAKGGAR